MDYQRHDTRKVAKSLDTQSSTSTDASPSSHPARQRELRLRGITEEEFVQDSKSSESPGYKGLSEKDLTQSPDQLVLESSHAASDRETGKSRLRQLWDALSGSRKEKDIRITIEKLEQAIKSLSEVTKGLDNTVESVSAYDDYSLCGNEQERPYPVLKKMLEMYGEIKKCAENLDKLVETHQVSDGNFQKFFESKKELIENEKQSLVKVKDEKRLKGKLDEFEAEVKRCYELFDKAKSSLGLKTLEMFKDGKLKENLNNTYSFAREKIKTIRLENEFMNKWVDIGRESILLKIRKSNEYSSFKDNCLKLEQIYKQMEKLEEAERRVGESSQEILHQKDQLLENLATTYREFYEMDKGLREKLQDGETKAQWVLKGQKICEYAEAKSAERRERGMTRSVIEQSWKSFYRYWVQGVWMSERFDKLMKAGRLKGEAGDYYIVEMEPKPKLPGKEQPFDEFQRTFTVYVNPKEGVLVHDQEDRETERQWRERNFPKKFPQKWCENIKKTLGIEEIPKEFFEPLYISDLSVLAYQLAVEKYKGEQSQSGDQNNKSCDPNWFERAPGARNLLSNDLSPAPLTEIVVAQIVNAETTAMLHDYMELGNSVIFERGKKGFNLVSATPFGRRIPFMQSDYRDIIGDGIIDRYEMYRVSGKLYIKGIIKPKDKSGA